MGILDIPVREAIGAALGVIGVSCTLKRNPVTTDYDPVTGTRTTGTALLSPGNCSPPKGVNKFSRFNSAQIGDQSVFVAAQGLMFEPLAGDVLTVGGKTYKVMEVNPSTTGDSDCGYKLLLRK